MISQFLSGLLAVLALIVVGCTLALVLSGMAKRFPFSRLALVLALSPMAFIRVLQYEGNTTLQLYSMIVILLGITIDGINYLLEPKARQSAPKETATEADEPAAKEESSSGMIVWEKAK